MMLYLFLRAFLSSVSSFILIISSQEVVGRSEANVGEFGLARGRVKLQKVVFHVFVNFHDGSLVAAAVAVVRCGEDGHDVALVRPIVPVHD